MYTDWSTFSSAYWMHCCIDCNLLIRQDRVNSTRIFIADLEMNWSHIQFTVRHLIKGAKAAPLTMAHCTEC